MDCENGCHTAACGKSITVTDTFPASADFVSVIFGRLVRQGDFTIAAQWSLM
jgi:hypothetical protein